MTKPEILEITSTVSIPLDEIVLAPIRAQGAGGQNVNKVSSAVHLRFDIMASSLAPEVKSRLLKLRDRRISKDGVVVIKAQAYRTREKNCEDALERLRELLLPAFTPRVKRVATKPSRSARAKRVDQKTRRGKVKTLRKKISGDTD